MLQYIDLKCRPQVVEVIELAGGDGLALEVDLDLMEAWVRVERILSTEFAVVVYVFGVFEVAAGPGAHFPELPSQDVLDLAFDNELGQIVTEFASPSRHRLVSELVA